MPRERAVVSVFDAGFLLGDGVWEGLRVWGGHPAFLEGHLDRLFEGAKAIMLDVGRSCRELTEAIRAHPTLANIPVLILSSRSSELDRRRGLDAGADGYIIKSGFDEGSLLAAVNRLLGARA